jgi:large subunit ribosomal protein L22
MAAVEERTEVRAEARYVRAAPRKAQLIVDEIRGRPVPEARTILAFMTRDAARDVRKVLDSAAANAEANHGLDSDELYVVGAFVGAGPTLKRWKARARGRVGRIKKRTCHITIALAPAAGEVIPAPIERPAPVTLTEEPEPIVVDDATGEVVSGEAAVEEAPAEEAPAEAKPKRSRKKAAEPEAEVVEAEAPAAEEAPAEEAEEAPEVEEAPKPKRTRAAKPKAEEAPAEAAEPEAEAQPDAEAEAKPKTRKKKTETDEGSES